jgi:hypothetical protein
MEQLFDSMESGNNPAWNYMTGRNATALNNQYAARGGYDSGAALQGQSDLSANEAAQEQGILDTLGQGASNERQNNLSSMLGFGMGLGSGGAGTAGMYDTGAAGAMSNANSSATNLAMQSAMIKYMANQGFMNNLFSLLGGGMGMAGGSG